MFWMTHLKLPKQPYQLKKWRSSAPAHEIRLVPFKTWVPGSGKVERIGNSARTIQTLWKLILTTDHPACCAGADAGACGGQRKCLLTDCGALYHVSSC